MYVKGNGSYIRVNPWRDGNVSRLLYEEYKTNLEEDQAIKIGEWHTFKMEVTYNALSKTKESHMEFHSMACQQVCVRS